MKKTVRSPKKLSIDKTPLRPLSAQELAEAAGGTDKHVEPRAWYHHRVKY